MGKRKYGVFNKISNIRKNVYAREDDKFSLGLVSYTVQSVGITSRRKSGMSYRLIFVF